MLQADYVRGCWRAGNTSKSHFPWELVTAAGEEAERGRESGCAVSIPAPRSARESTGSVRWGRMAPGRRWQLGASPKAEAAWAEALEWLGAKEQEAESVSDSAVPQFWGP